jgi:hypothetical protein
MECHLKSINEPKHSKGQAKEDNHVVSTRFQLVLDTCREQFPEQSLAEKKSGRRSADFGRIQAPMDQEI